MRERRRAGATAVATLVAAVGLLAPAAASAAVGVSSTAAASATSSASAFAAGTGTAPAGAELGPLAGSESAAAHWTAARRAAAEPLDTELPAGADGLESIAASASSSSAEAPSTKSATPQTKSASIEGVDTGESTLFPNRANGKIFGEYVIRGKTYEYECSGSVVDSPYGDVVLTAGHCVIDPESGVVARGVVFVPGYREGADPYGVWTATAYATTETWKATAGTSSPNEGGDLSFLVLEDNSSGKSVEETVGSLNIAFDQARAQTYTQYGYPAEEPYDGEVLYKHTAAYDGTDLNDPFLKPSPIKIASDFTAGSSGGPWTVGSSSSPTVASVTDYGYEDEPGYLYGAYFGEAARSAYEVASGAEVAAGIEDGVTAESEAATSSGAATTTPSTGVPTPSSTSKSSADALRIKAIRRHPANGTATITVVVGGEGTLSLRGSGVAASSQEVTAGTWRVTVRTKGSTARKLLQDGSVTVTARLTLATASGTRHLSRTLRLIDR
jgi:V8-like Glu-specific endopeptidase